MKIVSTIEARMTSSRLPGKVMMEAAGKPMLQHLIERLQRVDLIMRLLLLLLKMTQITSSKSFQKN